MLEKTRGIFLHSVKYSETSIIAVIYTEAYGRLTFIVNGVGSKKSTAKSVVFQPLYLLDFVIYYKPGRAIQRLKDVRISNPYSSIPFDIRKSSQVILLSEILYKCLKEEEPNKGLFDFIYNSLSFLDISDQGVSNFHVWFLFKLTQFLGIYPSGENASVSNFFDLQKAQFVSQEPNHSQFADKQLSLLISRLFNANYSDLDSLAYTQNDRRFVLDILLAFYRIHFDNIGELKSLNILKEVFK